MYACSLYRFLQISRWCRNKHSVLVKMKWIKFCQNAFSDALLCNIIQISWQTGLKHTRECSLFQASGWEGGDCPATATARSLLAPFQCWIFQKRQSLRGGFSEVVGPAHLSMNPDARLGLKHVRTENNRSRLGRRCSAFWCFLYRLQLSAIERTDHVRYHFLSLRTKLISEFAFIFCGVDTELFATAFVPFTPLLFHTTEISRIPRIWPHLSFGSL